MSCEERPVDLAMAQNRPEKQAIRGLWVNEVKSIAEHYPNSDVPWYLTLPGAQGLDIQLLINEGLISLTEVNSIAEVDQNKIVAVESNNQAIAELQSRFIGLRIKEVPFQSIIRGDSSFSWPEGEDEKYCRAHVVNLDLNSPLKGGRHDSQIVFPVLSWIKKLCQLHAKPPLRNWTLCLTLHGEMSWPEEINRWVQDFFSENFQRENIFANQCEEFFGNDLFLRLSDDELDFTALNYLDQQKVIMVMVPKIIANLVHSEGWEVHTEWNLRYGGEDSRAPMVTWIVKFTWNGDATATPDALYCSALRKILLGVGIITKQGNITRIRNV